MSQPISNLARLRAGTRDAHERIEAVPVLARLVAPDLTRNEYVAALQHLHAFHVYAEPVVGQELAGWPEAAAMLDGNRPRALADDLAWFGAQIILPVRLPVIHGVAAALGALYVIEGSGLGGRVIARYLTESLGVARGAGGSFYCRQDADSARHRWQRLTTLLESLSSSGQDPAHEQLVHGALETFETLEYCLRTIKIVPEHDDTLAQAEAVVL